MAHPLTDLLNDLLGPPPTDEELKDLSNAEVERSLARISVIREGYRDLPDGSVVEIWAKTTIKWFEEVRDKLNSDDPGPRLNEVNNGTLDAMAAFSKGIQEWIGVFERCLHDAKIKQHSNGTAERTDIDGS